MKCKVGSFSITVIWYLTILLGGYLLVLGLENEKANPIFLAFIILASTVILSASQRENYQLKKVLLLGFALPILLGALVATVTYFWLVYQNRSQNIVSKNTDNTDNGATLSGVWYYPNRRGGCTEINLNPYLQKVPFCEKSFIKTSGRLRGRLDFICKNFNREGQDKEFYVKATPVSKETVVFLEKGKEGQSDSIVGIFYTDEYSCNKAVLNSTTGSEKQKMLSKGRTLQILGLCKKKDACSHKSFNFDNVDLNEDGLIDVIITDRRSENCGSGGCTSVIGINTGQSFKVGGEIFNLSIAPTSNTSNGYTILKKTAYDYTGPNKSEKVEYLRWDGTKYK